MLWLATINPAGKTRRKRRRRRKLSAWQRMVKQYGGVQGALRMRRKLRKKKGKRRSARKNARRVFRRTRPRRASRRHDMARVKRRRRRLPARGRGGRFTRRARTRRTRRNRGENPWARFRVPGRWQKQWRGRRGRFSRRNPVIPVSWNPRRRRYRRNAVLPLTLTNPLGALGGVVGRLQDFVDVGFWTDTALPATAGFLGSKVVGGMLFGLVGEKLLGVRAGDKSAPFVRAGTNALAGAGLAWAAGNFLGRKYEDPIWLGVVVSVAHDLLKALLGGTEIARTIGLDGLGEDLTDKMREAVSRRVEAELSGGVGAYLTQTALQPQVAGLGYQGEFITDTDLRRQPAYAATPGGDLRDYDVSRTETAL